MKASTQLQGKVRAAIAPINTARVRQRYLDGDFPRSDRTKDLDKRYRWDLFWAVRDGSLYDDAASEGLIDAHIDTMLRSIVPPLREENQ
jgi:hypothetical protein